jgi:hypothetical protein
MRLIMIHDRLWIVKDHDDEGKRQRLGKDKTKG